jgi:uncharacterized membrane protein/ribosomal protein L40E
MKFCAKCGNGNDDDSKFCRKCGNPIDSPAGGDTIIAQPPPSPAPVTVEAEKPVNKPAASTAPAVTPLPEAKAPDSGTTSLPANVAHFLCYIAGWVSGIVFLIIEKKDRATHFHAWQSIITFGTITVLSWLFTFMPAVGMLSVGWFFSWAVWAIIYVGGLALWIILIIKALQGLDYHLPIVGPIAHNLAYKDGPAESQPGPQKPAPAATKIDLPPLPAGKGADKATGTKFCIACGEPLPQKAVFCSRCGEKQP